MSEPIQDIGSKESMRLSKLKEVRGKDLADEASGGGVEIGQKEFAAKRRRDLGRLNKAKLNHNEKEPAIRPLEDAPFVPALMAAVLKDIFDLAILGLQAVAGASVVLSPLIAVGIALGSVITWCISIFIAFMLILAGQGGKRMRAKRVASNLIKRGIVWGGFTIVETIPGLGALPLETLMVLVIFLMVVKERKKIIKLSIVKVPENNVYDLSARRRQAKEQLSEDFKKAA